MKRLLLIVLMAYADHITTSEKPAIKSSKLSYQTGQEMREQHVLPIGVWYSPIIAQGIPDVQGTRVIFAGYFCAPLMLLLVRHRLHSDQNEAYAITVYCYG